MLGGHSVNWESTSQRTKDAPESNDSQPRGNGLHTNQTQLRTAGRWQYRRVVTKFFQCFIQQLFSRLENGGLTDERGGENLKYTSWAAEANQ